VRVTTHRVDACAAPPFVTTRSFGSVRVQGAGAETRTTIGSLNTYRDPSALRTKPFSTDKHDAIRGIAHFEGHRWKSRNLGGGVPFVENLGGERDFFSHAELGAIDRCTHGDDRHWGGGIAAGRQRHAGKDTEEA
jgi:hypothetical protein